eukprot:gb/GECG01015405.1/.p1 GENE.gb/GECG01015405.1/~~gb/GECG01015405.1/.p1  ORF type:complete len:507 (+),score=53.62 gb/GECG01015405.1/:1-1521(+)
MKSAADGLLQHRWSRIRRLFGDSRGVYNVFPSEFRGGCGLGRRKVPVRTVSSTANGEESGIISPLMTNEDNAVSNEAGAEVFQPPESHEFETPVDITFGDISLAAYRIKNGVLKTPVSKSHRLAALSGCKELYFKKEFWQYTGSFKERGARNALLKMDKASREKGVIAASAGNHAQALAYHARDLGIPCTVYMPTIAPLTKIDNCAQLGCQVVVEGAHIGEARDAAFAAGAKLGMTYINGYDHPQIIAGAGTIGLEIIEQVPDVEAVVIPVGGAGLIAGVSLAIKALRPDVKVYGAEPAVLPSLTAALEAGHPMDVGINASTLADGLFVPKVGLNAFRLARQFVDKVVTVRENYIALAMLRLLELEKNVVEGGGATGLAALLQGLLPELSDKKVVIPLCGGNIDTPVLGRVIERGLAADGRLVQFSVAVPDAPGGIAKITTTLAQIGVSIRDIYHERAWMQSDFSKVQTKFIVETRGFSHAEQMRQKLQEAGLNLTMGPKDAGPVQ